MKRWMGEGINEGGEVALVKSVERKRKGERVMVIGGWERIKWGKGEVMSPRGRGMGWSRWRKEGKRKKENRRFEK